MPGRCARRNKAQAEVGTDRYERLSEFWFRIRCNGTYTGADHGMDVVVVTVQRIFQGLWGFEAGRTRTRAKA